MRKIFLTSVAAAALAACGGAAVAQTIQAPATGGAAKAESTEHQAPGALSGALNGNINGPGAAKAARTPAKDSKADQPTGQDHQKQQ